MRRTLVLRREALTELATGDLLHVVGGANTITCIEECQVYITTPILNEITDRVTRRTCTAP